MNTLSFSTHFATPEEADKQWVVVDAAAEPIVGRLASKVAKILRGKYKPCFTPNQDCGDNVIIINANKIEFTGAKWTDKEYITFSGYPSGQHRITAANQAKKPFGYERILRHAVKGMLPKGRLGAKVLKNLYIFDGPEHDKQAQTPKTIDIKALK
ncbi:MAG: 50S ribosomal protein L13 [Prevotellaceae bacterium]|nr:50S ribosomal protein L13 [Prevotellaceae bacterium]